MTFIKPIAVIFQRTVMAKEFIVDYFFIQVSSVLFTPLTVAPADY